MGIDLEKQHVRFSDVIKATFSISICLLPCFERVRELNKKIKREVLLRIIFAGYVVSKDAKIRKFMIHIQEHRDL